jgi:hypothetical protein
MVKIECAERFTQAFGRIIIECISEKIEALYFLRFKHGCARIFDFLNEGFLDKIIDYVAGSGFSS